MGCGGSKVKPSSVKSSSVKPSSVREAPQVAPNTDSSKKLLDLDSFTDVYQICEKLATLPSAEIRRCVHKASNVSRAVKVVQLEPSETSLLTEKKIRNEVRALSNLDHPNILKTYDILFDTKRFYVLMEPWEGGKLLDIVGGL